LITNRTFRTFAGLALTAVLAAGCRQDMHDAPRYDPLEASDLFANGSAARPLMGGTVARGQLNEDAYLHTGKDEAGQPVTAFPFAITRADLDRGQERYDVYCAPCHSQTGDGDGMIVQRGYRQPPSLHLDRLRQAPVGYFYDVIANGFGVMPDYRAQVPVDDRWRIVAYVRALQMSRQATVADVPADVLEQLRRGATSVPAAGSAPATGEIHR
jgi:mono/diheme cytochrome c family protein